MKFVAFQEEISDSRARPQSTHGLLVSSLIPGETQVKLLSGSKLVTSNPWVDRGRALSAKADR
ncbi:hypothetical protein OUZ56_017172 [Daphnia magna]|uniref:Uncharacterized protein n=1 Tax=Daphnia magna TaxID=35525 RepID=A0ABR0ASC6_9CRUS|nr:hypothetical protein OUZ56_017172 [Daphnia magna]